MLEGWKESVSDLNTERMLILNPKEISKENRDKIYSCIDPLELVKVINNNKLVPAFGLVPTGLPGAIETPLVKKCIITVGSKETSIPLTYTSGGVDEKIAVALRDMLKKENITITLVPISRDQYIKDLLGQKTPAILASKGLDYFEAYSILSYFHSGIPGNVFHVHSKTIDKKLDEAQTIVDTKARAKKYQELQQIILEKRTVVPLTFGSEVSGLWSKKVASIPSHPGGMHTLPLETISLVK
jgi:ABC-type transport system substrate-binding protein